MRGIEVSSTGLVRHSKVPNGFLPCVNAAGYRIVSIGGRHVKVHQLVAEAFLPSKPSELHTVDHINGTRGDNRLENLRWATKKEQTANRALHNADAHQGRTPIEYRRCGEDSWTLVDSGKTATNCTGVSSGLISRCCNHAQPQSKGFEFRFAVSTIEGEEWRHVTGMPLTTEVSNMGRIVHKSAAAFTPLPTGTTEYAMFSGQRVHVLVAQAFLPSKPSSEHTIDHINRNKADNRASNLRWATPSEQRHNQVRSKSRASTLKKAVAAKVNGIPRIFESAIEAERQTGIAAQNIAKVCLGKRKRAGDVVWSYV